MNAHQIEGRRWFQQAQADLEVVRTLRTAGHHATACFHSQQAAEKALKGVLYSQGARVVLGHSVQQLAQQCETHDSTFADIDAEASLLDQFYIPTRYPTGLPSPAVPSETYTSSEAEAVQEAAKRVLQIVINFLWTHTNVLD
jgi:HEPN domain-containing protein